MTTLESLHEVCRIEELWDGDMETFDVGPTRILLLKLEGTFHAYQAACPHQGIPLVEGKLDDGVLTCRAHLWQFAAATGRGLNPANCRLRRYPVEVRADVVWVGDRPLGE